LQALASFIIPTSAFELHFYFLSEHSIDQLAADEIQTPTTRVWYRVESWVPRYGRSANGLRKCCFCRFHCFADKGHSDVQAGFPDADFLRKSHRAFIEIAASLISINRSASIAKAGPSTRPTMQPPRAQLSGGAQSVFCSWFPRPEYFGVTRNVGGILNLV